MLTHSDDSYIHIKRRQALYCAFASFRIIKVYDIVSEYPTSLRAPSCHP